MIQKNDLIILLSDMEDKGIDIGDRIEQVIASNIISLDILSFINKNRSLDVTSFYNRIRQNHNKKRSDLYMNILKEVEDPDEVITTLSAFVLQSVLFAKHVGDKVMFLKHVRLEECTKVLNIYSKTYDYTNAINLLKLIKSDLIACETIDGRRN